MTEIIKNVYFDEFYLTMIRVLKLIGLFEEKNKYKLTQKKVVLFDFYLRFPVTTTEELDNEDFDEKYSFYHWKPNYSLYNSIISVLISKNLITVIEKEDDKCYVIADCGKKVLAKLECDYMNQLSQVGIYVLNNISKLSDKRIDEDIVSKSSYLRKMGVLQDE